MRRLALGFAAGFVAGVGALWALALWVDAADPIEPTWPADIDG